VTLIHPYNAIKNAAEKYSVNDSYEFNITYPEFYIKESWSTHWSKKWYNTPYYVNPFENCFFEKVNKFFGTYIDDCNSFYIGTDSTMSGESRKFKIILSSKVLQNFLDIMGFQSIENDPTNKKGLTNENWQNKL